jgi:hypothetical protein
MCYGKQDFSFSTKKTAIITLYYMRLNQDDSIHFMIIISFFFREEKKIKLFKAEKHIIYKKNVETNFVIK